ncbi:MAG: sigma 54-interacting transcriptional regulator [Kofleriaceae bacterium]
MAVGGTETQTLDYRASVGVSSYVIAIDDTSSRQVELPVDGEVSIGRSREAQIQINSDAASRLHAKLLVSGGRVAIEDLGSHNGTSVNGERVRGTQPLASGDVVTIADTILILRTSTLARIAEPITLDQMTQRIEQEIARASEYDRPFTLVMLRAEGSARRSMLESVASVLRPMDIVSATDNAIVALLPELDRNAGRAQAQALVDVIGPSTRVGIVAYPTDGGDATALLAVLRSALAVAEPGKLANVSSATIEHRIGGARVLVADPVMLKLFELLRRLARSDLAVLVTGETGAGKENAAAAVHHWSPRSAGPLVALNCAALPETLAESELFGYERGAFSDAKQAKPGLFERATGGTLFLDEVGDLSLALQAKLLRALEQKKIMRLGDVREREVDVRIVAATNVDLEQSVAKGTFRQDLLFRLSAATVAIPPLRHRRQEIPLLARVFMQLEAQRLEREGLELSETTLAQLTRYDFPGNVRELKNAIDFAVATTEGPTIQPWDLPGKITGSAKPDQERPTGRKFRPIVDEIRDLERQRIVEALDANDGVQTHAAAALGMPLRTFTFRMRQYGIDSRRK